MPCFAPGNVPAIFFVNKNAMETHIAPLPHVMCIQVHVGSVTAGKKGCWLQCFSDSAQSIWIWANMFPGPWWLMHCLLPNWHWAMSKTGCTVVFFVLIWMADIAPTEQTALKSLSDPFRIFQLESRIRNQENQETEHTDIIVAYFKNAKDRRRRWRSSLPWRHGKSELQWFWELPWC